MGTPKMILFDLDGTVLNSDKKISEYNRQVLCQAMAQGVEIVPATGRFFKSMPEVVMELPFRYAITINGASIYDRETDTVLHNETFDGATAVEVYQAFDQIDGIYDCYYDGWGYMEQTMHAKGAEYAKTAHVAKMIETFRRPVADIKAFVADKDIEKVQIFCKDMEERQRQLADLPKRFPQLNITTSVPGNIEVNSQQAHKGAALVKLCEILDIDVADTVAFGDDLNDATMLSMAGIGVAMANAKPDVQAKANRIGPTNDEDGVGKVVAELLGY